jgi:hypothetical protein
MFDAMVMRRMTAAAMAAFVVFAVPEAAGAARHKPPQIKRVRCVPASSPTCATAIRLAIGRQLQFSGRRLVKGMRVSFRWPGGAIATTLDRTRVGYVARVPAGTRPGTVAVTVSDRAGRRSNGKRITVLSPAPPPAAPAPVAPGTLPEPFRGNGMWIWQLERSEAGNPAAIAARARASGISTVFVKSSDGPRNRWSQFNPRLVQALHENGIRACAWQFVYGNDPIGEASLGADAVADGADCLVIDAESAYKGKYAAAQRFMTALRAAVGPDYPIGFTSFPYVDYHATVPYSVFLGPGGAQANLPQVYWRDIGGSVEAVSARTLVQNRIYGVPLAPIGQTYQDPPAGEFARFRSLWAAYGAGGLSWWSWQETNASEWAALAQPLLPLALPPADPGWPTLAKGAKGDQVIRLQQHLASANPSVKVNGSFDAATDAALRALQASRGLAATGATDAATWQALLELPLAQVNWVR